jgi:hypothetical protein
MRNHFHLVIETPKANLVEGMKWLSGVYTKRFNIRNRLCGHVFAGRYKALIVDGSESGYLRTVCDYVHLNPVRAKIIRPQAKLESFRWSSYVEYLKPPDQRSAWLRVDRLLGEHGIQKDSDAGRQEFRRKMELRRQEEAGTDYRAIHQGWCLGSNEFRRELLESATEQVGDNHYGSDRSETGEAKAQRIVMEELIRLGWKEADLVQHRKGDPEKVEMAYRLRKETIMSLNWIAQRLHMGSWTYVSNLLIQKAKQSCVNSED